ncbi:hypothetical protein [Rhizobium leguminosarum]|uniref:hypothetical protein n=1 Tax=Rhizobium leguminosarum TaxID=384 RepID=UPI001C90B01B|nr:hypothetical protein [Rhizobium leguminosarum]MBY2909643.1 hypothetical protein [Rhizobium leguminosarum]MBY2949874.1 hypothetical protein [Rhizobium leguminosarum]
MKLSGSVSFRPVRIGFLTPIDDLALLSRIARLTTCLWGGRYNPIIPFFENGGDDRRRHPNSKVTGLDIARAYINFFEPDVLVEAAPGMAKALGWAEGDRHFVMPRILTLDEFFELDDRGSVQFSLGVDIFEVMAHLYDTDFRYERRHKEPFAKVAETEVDAFFDVVGGRHPSETPLAYISKAYDDVFTPVALPPDATTALRYLKDDLRGPFWVTGHELDHRPGRGHRNETFYVFDPTVPGDVIDYWNFRLVAPHVMPINVNWIGECAEFIRDEIQAIHRPIPGNSSGTMFHSTICLASSIDEERCDQIAKEHFADLPEGAFYFGSNFSYWKTRGRGRNRRDSKIIVYGEPIKFDEKSERGTVKIPAPSPSFINYSKRYSRARWMNVIALSTAHLEDTVATVYPSNLWKLGYPRLSGGEFRITREGWVVEVEYDIGYGHLKVETGRNAIIDWLDTQGIAATPSEEGQIAAQVIAAAGGLMASGMFADLDTLKLLGEMAESHSEVSRNGRRVAKATPDRSKHVNTIRQHFKERKKRSFGYWNELNYFLERSVFRAGLRVQCPICGHQNWFDLDAVSYKPVCTRCLNGFEFSQSPSHIDNVDWFYRIVGPFAAPDYARGGYAVALTLRALSGNQNIEMTWSTGLTLKPLNCEVDFVAWRRATRFGSDERDEPILVVGEAKSFGRNSINNEAIVTLKKVAESFPGCVMVVSMLRKGEELSLGEIGRLRHLALWGRRSEFEGEPVNPLVLLTQIELLGDRGIRGSWEKIDGMKMHAIYDVDDLHTLADLTLERYLGLGAHWDKQAAGKTLEPAASILLLLKARAATMRAALNDQ